MPPPAHDGAPEKPLRERILDVMALYPEPRSAIIPALRLAQDEYGWLSTEALEAVADATGFTPALAKSVASFYDMFRLTPAGAHEICVCTNVSCALVGAGETLRELERQLGSTPARPPPTAGSRCAPWSATAAAGGGRSSRSTSATTSRAGPTRSRASSASCEATRMSETTRILLDFDGRPPRRPRLRAGGRLRLASQGDLDGARRRRRPGRRVRPSRARRRRVPDRPQGVVPAQGQAAGLPVRERRRVRARHVQGPRDHAPKPARADRGRPHHELRDRRDLGVHLHPRRVPHRVRGAAAGARRRPQPRLRRAERPRLGLQRDGGAAPRRRRLHLRRGDRAPLVARGGARAAALEAAVSRRGGALRRADARQQRRDAGRGAVHPRDGRRGVRRPGHRALEGHARVLAVGERAPPGKLRAAAHLDAARPDRGPRRRGARGPDDQGDHPRRLLDADPAPRPARHGHRLRVDRRGRVDGRVGRHRRDRRPHVHGAAGPTGRGVLPPRELRQVHAVPRGHALGRRHHPPHRDGRGGARATSTCC